MVFYGPAPCRRANPQTKPRPFNHLSASEGCKLRVQIRRDGEQTVFTGGGIWAIA